LLFEGKRSLRLYLIYGRDYLLAVD